MYQNFIDGPALLLLDVLLGGLELVLARECELADLALEQSDLPHAHAHTRRAMREDTVSERSKGSRAECCMRSTCLCRTGLFFAVSAFFPFFLLLLFLFPDCAIKEELRASMGVSLHASSASFG